MVRTLIQGWSQERLDSISFTSAARDLLVIQCDVKTVKYFVAKRFVFSTVCQRPTMNIQDVTCQPDLLWTYKSIFGSSLLVLLTNVAAAWLALLLRILELPAKNTEFYRGFPPSLQGKWLKLGPDSLIFKSLIVLVYKKSIFFLSQVPKYVN